MHDENNQVEHLKMWTVYSIKCFLKFSSMVETLKQQSTLDQEEIELKIKHRDDKKRNILSIEQHDFAYLATTRFSEGKKKEA